MSIASKSRRLFRFSVCSALVLTAFWITHEWERRATLQEYAQTDGVAAEQQPADAADAAPEWRDPIGPPNLHGAEGPRTTAFRKRRFAPRQ